MDNKNFRIGVPSTTVEQKQEFLKFAFGDDIDFYEEYLMSLPVEDQVRFFQNNPNFMSEFFLSYDKIYLLRDKMYRELLRKIKTYEGGKIDE